MYRKATFPKSEVRAVQCIHKKKSRKKIVGEGGEDFSSGGEFPNRQHLLTLFFSIHYYHPLCIIDTLLLPIHISKT